MAYRPGLATAALLASLPLTGPALAQPRPAMPPAVGLPAGAAATPFREPVDVGGEAWGPFRRLCHTVTLRGPGQAKARREAGCMMFLGDEPITGGRRITATISGEALQVRFDRGNGGEVTNVTPLLPAGSAALPEADRRRLEEVLVDNLRTISVRPRRVGPGDTVIVEDRSAADIAGTQEFVRMPCVADGLARYRGRSTLVLRCAHSPVGRNEAASFGGAARGTVLVDLAIGLTLHQRHNARVAAQGTGGERVMSAGGVVTIRLD